jgi:hypothetical protein
MLVVVVVVVEISSDRKLVLPLAAYRYLTAFPGMEGSRLLPRRSSSLIPLSGTVAFSSILLET